MPGKPKFLDQVRHSLRLKNYSYRTEQAYVGWIKRYILYYNKRHPAKMGWPEVESFLKYLAVERADKRYRFWTATDHGTRQQRAVKRAAKNAGIDKRVPPTPSTTALPHIYWKAAMMRHQP
jgi:hypothetical protein